MLAEIAAANAAFAVIKKAIQNGRELHSVGKAIANFTHAQDDIRKFKEKKKNSIWSKFTGKDEHALEEFMALEEIKEKEEQLKQMMIYLGRPGLHSDWVRFHVEARKNRKEAAEQQAKDRAELAQNIQTFLIWFLSIALVTGVLALSIAIAQRKGWI